MEGFAHLVEAGKGLLHGAEGAEHAGAEVAHAGQQANSGAKAARGAQGEVKELKAAVNESKIGEALKNNKSKIIGGLGLAGVYAANQLGFIDIGGAGQVVCEATTGNGPISRVYGGGTTQSPDGEGTITETVRTVCNCTIPNDYKFTKTLMCGTLLDSPMVLLGIVVFLLIS